MVRLNPLRLRAGCGEDVADRGLRRDVRDLREIAKAEAGLEHEVPQVRLRLAGKELEEGALARAVGADEGDLLPLLDQEVRVLEDERAAPGLPEVSAGDDRRHVPRAIPWLPIGLRPAMKAEATAFDHMPVRPTRIPAGRTFLIGWMTQGTRRTGE